MPELSVLRNGTLPGEMLSSVAKALKVLDILGLRGDLGVSEIARGLGLTPATTHRLLRALVVSEFVVQDPVTRRYQLGNKILTLAGQVRGRVGLREMLRPVLEDLAAATGETVNLGVLLDDEVVYIEKIDSSEMFRIEVQVGARMPAYCTALGRVILASQDPALTSQYLKRARMVAHTPNTIVDRQKLMEELARIKTDGYALDRGELLADVWCVAAPVMGDSGMPVGAISISAPHSRFVVKRDKLLRLITERTRNISAVMAGAGAA